jgi:hypothetical protein
MVYIIAGGYTRGVGVQTPPEIQVLYSKIGK